MTASFLAAWMVQGIVIAALLAATAALLQWIARDAVPARAIWGVALVGATLLTASAPLRIEARTLSAGAITVRGAALPASVVESPSFDAAELLRVAAARARRALEAPMHAASDAMKAVPSSVARGAAGGWLLAAVTILLVFALSHRRLQRALHSAESHQIAGVPVRLTADLGPAVVGVRAPVVAVPRWLLDLPSAEQALVVRHEQSHVAAGDPLLLMLGLAMAAMQPWNPFAWLMVSRLRLAIELDCDRRLLRSGTSPRAYGDLLIALSAAASPAPRPAVIHPMFSIHRSHLAQRIIAMTERPVRLITARRFAVTALAALAFVAACESRLPTDAEVASMDASMIEERVVGVPMLDASTTRWYVDGKLVTTAEAKEIPTSRIASVEVKNGAINEIRLTTGEPAERPRAGVAEERRRVEGYPLDASMVVRDTPSSVRVIQRPQGTDAFMKGFTGVLVIDDVVVDHAKFGELTPDRIESVSVHKGQAAINLYGAGAANGAIVIKTKPRR